MRDFLDVTFDLTLGTYKPFSKPNNQHLYVDKKSNHPLNVPNNIAGAVNDKLSGISSNEGIFNEAAKEYPEPIKKRVTNMT